MRTVMLLGGVFLALSFASGSSRFSPYDNNGGLNCAIAGEDYCILATSMEHISNDIVVNQDPPSRITRLTPSCQILTAGCQADCTAIIDVLKKRVLQTEFDQSPMLTPTQLAQITSHTLYQRRGFVYYSHVIVGGIGPSGKGCVWGYDSIGSFELGAVACNGDGSNLLQPILDRVFLSGKEKIPTYLHRTNENSLLPPVKTTVSELDPEKAIKCVFSGFRSVANRQQGNVGLQKVKIVVLKKGGFIDEKVVNL